MEVWCNWNLTYLQLIKGYWKSDKWASDVEMMEDVESRYKFSGSAGHAGLSDFTKKDHGKALESPRVPERARDWWLWITHLILSEFEQSQMDWCSLGNENSRSNSERTFSHEEYSKWACGTKCQRQGGPGMCKSMLGSGRHCSGMGWQGRGSTRDICAVELFDGCTETLKAKPHHMLHFWTSTFPHTICSRCRSAESSQI